MKKVIVVGAGASGLMAAYAASNAGEAVTLFERNEKAGKKIYITGKGRCNVTNMRDISEYFDYIVSNPHFLYSSLYSFTNTDLINLIEEKGVKTKIERGQRVFPVSDKASDITRALIKANNNTKIVYNTKIEALITENEEIKGVIDDKGIRHSCDRVILCAGGKSYPSTGSDGNGYILAKKVGHTIIPPTPSLVPLVSNDNWIPSLAGLSLKNVEASLVIDGKVKRREFGEMLFTHKGISGPIILSLSSYYNKEKNAHVLLDLKPALDRAALEKRILRDFEGVKNKDFANSLFELLPKKLCFVIINLSGISPEKKINQITKEERSSLVDLIKNLDIKIKSKEDFSQAIITRGGISVKEINSSTMESRIIKGLYFAGEIIDVDAQTGGFNLQIAFSTGYLAGISSIK